MTLPIEPVRMMEPPSFKSGKAFCTVKSAPFTLMSNSLSKKFLGDAPQRREFAKTGIGENDIESALLPDDLQVGKFGYVSLNAGNVARDRLHGLIEFLLATAGDDCHFALKLTHDSYRAPIFKNRAVHNGAERMRLSSVIELFGSLK